MNAWTPYGHAPARPSVQPLTPQPRPPQQDPEEKFTPGDLGFDPLGFSDAGIRPDYALAEIKHARLAMLGALGMLFQVRFTCLCLCL